MRSECIIRFKISNQLLGWLKPHTRVPITTQCLPHWVMEMIAVGPHRAFIIHYTPTDTGDGLKELQTMIKQTANSINFSILLVYGNQQALVSPISN